MRCLWLLLGKEIQQSTYFCSGQGYQAAHVEKTVGVTISSKKILLPDDIEKEENEAGEETVGVVLQLLMLP